MQNRARDYRPDIDGLRCLAVVPVVVFHFGLARLAPGGFVGVDVFFVISGYLITGTIYRDVNEATYSVTDFYNRRILRIFPALFVMFILCAVFSAAIQFPADSSRVAKSLISSIFFVSNIYFYNLSGYFSGELSTNPLLHTWSLSVEEQFYIIFPLLIFLIRRFQRKTQYIILVAIAVASFILATFAVFAAPTAAFYLVQNRAWELFIGAILALSSVAHAPLPKASWRAECIGFVGILLIAGSVLLLSPSVPFPGPGALAACLGAAAVIYSGSEDTIVRKVLSSPPLRFIGLISYSLYLWHWPTYVFSRNFGEPRIVGKISLFVLSVLIATVSWRFVERPFRRKAYPFSAKATIAFGGALMIACTCVAVFLGPINRAIWAPAPQAEELLAYEDYDARDSMRVGTCFLVGETEEFSSFQKDKCLRIDPSRQNYLLIGDSHAAHLLPGLQSVYPTINFLQATASGCIPYLESRGARRCTDMMRYIFDEYLPTHRLDGIILSARWTADDVPAALATAARVTNWASEVILAGPIDEYDLPLPRILALAESHGNYVEMAAKHRKLEPLATDSDFAASRLPPRVSYESTYRPS
jgi:peptidoglycan/LPS O-acetylase OafA/YrhL